MDITTTSKRTQASPVLNAQSGDVRWQKILRRRFDRAAAAYGERALAQQTSADELLLRLQAWLDAGQLQRSRILDVGCGSGYLLRQLASSAVTATQADGLSQTAMLLAIDLSEGMLQVPEWQPLLARTATESAFYRICADASCLPLMSASLDIVISNFALHWCACPLTVLRELRRVLRVQGRAELVIPILGSLQGRSQRAQVGSSLVTAAVWREACDATYLPNPQDHKVGGWHVDEHCVMHYAEFYDTPELWLAAVRAIGVTARRDTGQGMAGRQALATLYAQLESIRTESGIALSYDVLCLSLTAVES